MSDDEIAQTIESLTNSGAPAARNPWVPRVPLGMPGVNVSPESLREGVQRAGVSLLRQAGQFVKAAAKVTLDQAGLRLDGASGNDGGGRRCSGPLREPSSAEPIAAEVDAFVAPFVATNNFSGALLVARKGHIILDKGYGLADRDTRVLNTPATRFQIAPFLHRKEK